MDDDRQRLRQAILGLPLAEREMALAKIGVEKMSIAEVREALKDLDRLAELCDNLQLQPWPPDWDRSAFH